MLDIGGESKKTAAVTVRSAVAGANRSADDQQNLQDRQNDNLWGGELRPVKAGSNEIEYRALKALNHGLERAWWQGDALRWILARVRCEILRCTPSEYDRLVDIGSKDLWKLELPSEGRFARLQLDSYTELFAAWEKLADTIGNPRTAARLREAKQEALKALASRQKRAVYGLLYAWRCEV
jgi:hypothetical protein